ncbi:MAG: hypothetical protein RIT10_410 [Bacteroidota bacterium]
MKYFFTSLFFIVGISHLMFSQNINLDILVIAGGGGAGYARGGGGGAGGYIYQTNVSFAPNSPKQITVGTGGAKGVINPVSGQPGIHASSGTNSSFGSTYIAIGGGGGGSYEGPPQNGYAGGSGGGGANQANASQTGYGGSGTSGQGNSGGNSRCGGGGEVCGGGGGGAGAVGTNGTSSGCNGVSSRPYTPGNGGNGIQNSITGTAVWYAGGGGGGGLSTSANIQGTNGNGGGQASYGGGGQCKVVSGNFQTEDGGPGVVIIRYAGSPVATGGTITQVGGFTIHKFTSNGTFSYTSNLPVELISFQANCLVDKTIITWSTASEHNADYFDVEFSRNGTDWELVKRIKAKGNSTEYTNYSIDDKTHLSGLNYYRLKQVDLDGNFKIYNVISSDCGNDNQIENLNIFPNPSFNDFTISFNNSINETKAKIKIYNMSGILEFENTYQLTINQNNIYLKDLNLNPGEYVVELLSGDKIARFKQIIK